VCTTKCDLAIMPHKVDREDVGGSRFIGKVSETCAPCRHRSAASHLHMVHLQVRTIVLDDRAKMRNEWLVAMVKLKRAYEPAARDDGNRVLVERLWPRGLKKADLPLAEWLKDVAPSTELRKWFAHDPKRWSEFKRRYL
jgi:hypothetical protein